MKNAVLALVFVVAMPLSASALTVEEIKARLEAILLRFDALKAQLAEEGRVVLPAPAASSLPTGLPCLSLGRTLAIGTRGDDVRELQRFLIAAGLLDEGNATGYFGPLTEAAVQRFQSIQRIVVSGSPETTGFGLVGPRTRRAILESCAHYDEEREARDCPRASSPPTRSCIGSWQAGYDSEGCFIGYHCAQSFSLTPLTPTTTSTLPSGTSQATSTPSAPGALPNLTTSGTSALQELIQNPAGATGTSPSLDSLGIGISDSGTQVGVGACIHEQVSYPAGTTISVACTSGLCASAGTGFITGQCTGGLWCIPHTAYCASVLTDIDQSAYEGGGAAPISSGYASNCPVEGWRVQLECTGGSCTSGFHVCRGGTWVYDSDQSVHLDLE